MKSIFVTREGYRLPGARIRCYNFAEVLAKYGLDTEVLSFSDTLGAKDGEQESCMLLRDKIWLNCKAIKRLAKEKEAVFFIQRFNYHAFAPYVAHLVNRNRIILDLDDWEMRENPEYYFGFYPSSKAHYFTRQIARKSIFCIAASRYLEEFLLQFNQKVYYIPTGVDTELFKPSLHGLEKGRIIFSWVGTLHKKEYVENIEFALDCFNSLRKKYSHIFFEITGAGIYGDDLARITKRCDDKNIVLRGWQDPATIPEYIATIQAGLFPIARDTKFNRAKSPTKLFEYMAMAKPVVASDIGEASHIIRDGDNGFLAKTKEEFMRKMQIVIEHSVLRQEMGEKARQTINDNYSLVVLGKRLHEIFKENIA
jgi:glycosyltransferase involved in cell wall biosynthesis